MAANGCEIAIEPINEMAKEIRKEQRRSATDEDEEISLESGDSERDGTPLDGQLLVGYSVGVISPRILGCHLYSESSI